MSCVYADMLETWLGSSRDSPILLHLVNRLTRSFALLSVTDAAEKYCGLVELCMEVYFETARESRGAWATVMQEIDFKMQPHTGSAEPAMNMIGVSNSKII